MANVGRPRKDYDNNDPMVVRVVVTDPAYIAWIETVIKSNDHVLRHLAVTAALTSGHAVVTDARHKPESTRLLWEGQAARDALFSAADAGELDNDDQAVTTEYGPECLNVFIDSDAR